MPVPEQVVSRQEQKERTRGAILAAALDLSRDQGFAQISLRQVARRAGVVPTAFYRHFDSVEELGLALVDESFSTLRQMIRDAQRDPRVFDNIINASAEILVEAVEQNKVHFGFVSRERVGGSPAVRQAIDRELELFVSELAVVLARLPPLETWTIDDVRMASRLFVRNMVANVEQIVEMPDGRHDLEEQIKNGMRREMRLIVIGFRDWRSTA